MLIGDRLHGLLHRLLDGLLDGLLDRLLYGRRLDDLRQGLRAKVLLGRHNVNGVDLRRVMGLLVDGLQLRNNVLRLAWLRGKRLDENLMGRGLLWRRLLYRRRGRGRRLECVYCRWYVTAIAIVCMVKMAVR